MIHTERYCTPQKVVTKLIDIHFNPLHYFLMQLLHDGSGVNYGHISK